MYNSLYKKILFASPHVADNGEAVPSRRLLTRSTSYIPYGEVFVEESSAGWQSPYYFNSKELDEETGLYYYGARYLNPTEARWMSVDPVFHPASSPYVYCLNNPVKMVDLDGMDEYSLSEDGSIKLLNETKSEYDILYATARSRNETQNDNFIKYKTNKDGSMTIINKSINVKKGVLSSCVKTASLKPLPKKGNDLSSDKCDHLYHYEFGSDENASMSFFKFVAANSEVEWSWTELNKDGRTQFDIFTSCNPLYERFGSDFAKAYSNFLVNFSHSHPKDKNEGNNAVSSKGDRLFRNQILDKIKIEGSSNRPRFWIYPQGAGMYTHHERIDYTY